MILSPSLIIALILKLSIISLSNLVCNFQSEFITPCSNFFSIPCTQSCNGFTLNFEEFSYYSYDLEAPGSAPHRSFDLRYEYTVIVFNLQTPSSALHRRFGQGHNCRIAFIQVPSCSPWSRCTDLAHAIRATHSGVLSSKAAFFFFIHYCSLI